MVLPQRQISTVDLERGILYYFLTDKAILQLQVSSGRSEWFTADTRLIIWQLLYAHNEKAQALLSSVELEFMLQKSYPGTGQEGLRQDILTEYEVILEEKPEVDSEAIIACLNEAVLMDDTEKLLSSAYADLQAGKLEATLAKLKQGVIELNSPRDKGEHVSLWGDVAKWYEESQNRKMYPEWYAGIPTGFETFDKMTGGLFKGELTVLFGLSGKGKSSLLKQMVVNIRKQGYNILHCSNEEDRYQVWTKYVSIETGVKYYKWKRGGYTEADRLAFEEYCSRLNDDPSKNGEIFIYNFPQQTDATLIIRKLLELKESGKRIDLLVVDYLDLMTSIKRAYNENDEGARVTGDLRQIALDFQIPVLVCTQAGEQAAKQELREHPVLTTSDVFGTKRKVHSANTLVGIVNKTATAKATVGKCSDQDLKYHRLVICVPKNRDGQIFSFQLLHQVETGRILEDLVPELEEELPEAHPEPITTNGGVYESTHTNSFQDGKVHPQSATKPLGIRNPPTVAGWSTRSDSLDHPRVMEVENSGTKPASLERWDKSPDDHSNYATGPEQVSTSPENILSTNEPSNYNSVLSSILKARWAESRRRTCSN